MKLVLSELPLAAASSLKLLLFNKELLNALNETQYDLLYKPGQCKLCLQPRESWKANGARVPNKIESSASSLGIFMMVNE